MSEGFHLDISAIELSGQVCFSYITFWSAWRTVHLGCFELYQFWRCLSGRCVEGVSS